MLFPWSVFKKEGFPDAAGGRVPSSGFRGAKESTQPDDSARKITYCYLSEILKVLVV